MKYPRLLGNTLLTICLSLFTILNSYAASANALDGNCDGWTRTLDDKYGISFLMPNKPEKLNRLTGKIPSVIYQTKNSTAVFGIVCSDFQQGGVAITGEWAKQFYEEMKQGSLAVPTAILKNEETLPFDNMLVKEIEYATVSRNREMTYFKRIFIRDGKVYQVTLGGRSRHRAQLLELKNSFFNSLSFNR